MESTPQNFPEFDPNSLKTPFSKREKRRFDFSSSGSDPSSPEGTPLAALSSFACLSRKPRKLAKTFDPEMLQNEFVEQAETFMAQAQKEANPNALKNFIATLLQTNANLRQSNEALKAEMASLHEKVDNLSSEVELLRKNSAPFSSEKVLDIVVKAAQESSELESKKNNFVVYGLAEVDQYSDKDVIDRIVSDSGHSPQVVKKIFRMGTGKDASGQRSKFPRLLKVQLNSYEAKSDIMRQQKKILENIPEMTGASYSQYLRDDLTQNQRDLHAARVREKIELNKNLKPGETPFVVYKFQVLRKKTKKN